MKRSARAASRDSAQRSLRLQLIQHDVPALALPLAEAPARPQGQHDQSATPIASIPQEKIDELLSGKIEARIQKLVQQSIQEHLDALSASSVAPAAKQATVTTHAAQHAVGEVQDVTEPYSAPPADAPSDASPTAHSRKPAFSNAQAATPAAGTTSGVRVVTRKSISGDAARTDATPSLARVAPVDREQSGLAPRCIAHAGQHYRGATEDEVIEAWNAMRERFHLSPENKIVARRALLKWLQQSKNVCASNVHWYGDFVAIRSCNVRTAKSHPAFGVDGWFILFDPNGDAVMREPLFSEAFETPNKRYAGAVPRLGKPAWLSEERRATAAARHGGADLRPFSPETADDLSAQDFLRGRAE